MGVCEPWTVWWVPGDLWGVCEDSEMIYDVWSVFFCDDMTL